MVGLFPVRWVLPTRCHVLHATALVESSLGGVHTSPTTKNKYQDVHSYARFRFYPEAGIKLANSAKTGILRGTMVNRMRSTPGHTGNRRSHHALAEPALTKCACGAFRRRHHACSACGMYRGKQVIDVVARTVREQRRTEKRTKNLESMGMAKGGEQGTENGEQKEKTENKKTESSKQ